MTAFAPTIILPTIILFASEDAANHLVAGIPAAARAIMDAGRTGDQSAVTIAVPGGWTPSALCIEEAQRLAPDVRWNAAMAEESATGIIDIPALRLQAKSIIAATGKAGDGIVSRHINRPISQAITRVVLRFVSARPWHATCAAGLTGVLMFAVLMMGGGTGLIIGAILFQLASIIDGVDGEMARATFRASDRGAMMDSITDAATNLGFIGGVSYNLYRGGAVEASLAGATGFAFLALGSGILALQSRQDGGAFTFDALKTRFREKPSRLKQWLTYITMRDFYALAACIGIVVGGAQPLLYVFAGVTIAWFAVLCWTLMMSRR